MTKREKAHMARLRAARGLPPQTRENLLERVASVQCYASSIINPERQRAVELHGFMAIFHPEVSAERVREMTRD